MPIGKPLRWMAPQAPGIHSGQYLMTYVTDIGYDEYVKVHYFRCRNASRDDYYKEAFTIKSSGKLSKGALLFMEKVGSEAASDSGGWKYSGVKPKGKKLKVKEKGFCHACHQA